MTEAVAPGFRFVTGGTLTPDNPSYVRRAADDQLLQACLAGRFAYVLSSRQMGKSSLLARTIEQLRERGVTVAMVDLTAIGTQGVTQETWYAGVLAEVERACMPQTDLFDWWAEAAPQPIVQRFIRYLIEVVLAELSGPVVILIDEIDSTLKLDFTDDFYAAIRHLHNARAEQPALARLSFVLAGVATPTELIRDPARTPFNIGQRIELADFNAAEARQLVERIGPVLADTDTTLAEVLRWTGGQPYLTQRLCALLAAQAGSAAAAEPVAAAVEGGLLSDSGRADPHFQSVARYMTESPAELKEELFATYAQVLAGRRVASIDTSPVHNRLRLCGIVKRVDEQLVTRNGIYRALFGSAWLRKHRPTFWTPTNRLWAGALAASLLVTIGFATLWLRAEQASAAARQARVEADAGRRQAEQATTKAQQATADAQAANLAADAAAALDDGDPDRALSQASQALATRVTPVSLWAAFAAAEAHQAEAALLGHTDAINQVALNPAGPQAATASHDGRVRLWRLPDGEPTAELRGHTGPVIAVAFSPDGQRLLSAGHDHTARLWDSHTGALLLTLQGHADRLMAAVFSPDGALIATASHDGTARLWRSADGQLLHTLRGHRHWVRHVVFSPDGRRLASGGNDADVRLWDVRSGQLRARLSGHRDWIRSLAFSPDGRQLLSASDDVTARLWSSRDGRTLQVLRGHRTSVRSAAFDASGERIVTGGGDGAVRLWRSGEGRPLRRWQHPRGWINAVQFAGHDQVLSSDDAGTTRLQPIAREGRVLTLLGHRQAVTSVAIDTNAEFAVSASDDRSARLWSLRPGSRAALLRPGQRAVNDVAWSADSQRLLLAGEDGVAQIHTLGSEQPPVTLQHDTVAAMPTAARSRTTANASTTATEITAVALSADGRYAATASKAVEGAAGAGRSTVQAFDARTGARLPLAGPGHSANANMVAFSADGHWLVSAGDDDQALLWPLASGEPPIALRGHQGAVNSAVFSADNRQVLTASSDGSARLWSMPDGRLLHTLAHSRDGERLRMASFSADGQHVATAGDDHHVRIWRTDTGTLLHTLEGHDDIVMSAHFSPDGRRLVSASQDRSARVWDLASGRTLFGLAAGRTDIARLAHYSADGRWIVTTSDDGHARLWRAEDGAAVGAFAHADWIWNAAFSPDGRHLATASEDGSAAVWDLQRSATDPAQLSAWMTRRLQRLHLQVKGR
jgi:WD40 repeat protein